MAINRLVRSLDTISSSVAVKANIEYFQVSISPSIVAVKKVVSYDILLDDSRKKIPADFKDLFTPAESQGLFDISEFEKVKKGTKSFEKAMSKLKLVPACFVKEYQEKGLSQAIRSLDATVTADLFNLLHDRPYDAVIGNNSGAGYRVVRMDYGSNLIYREDNSVIIPAIHFEYLNSYGSSILASKYDMAKVKACLEAMPNIRYVQSDGRRNMLDSSTYCERNVPYYQDNAGEHYVEMYVTIPESDESVCSEIRERFEKAPVQSPSYLAKILLDMDYFGFNLAGALLPPNPEEE